MTNIEKYGIKEFNEKYKDNAIWIGNIDEYDEKELFDLYRKSNSSVVLKGEYSLKGKKLSLKTVTISFGEEEIPYSEYYRDVPALGPVEVKIPVELDSENKLNIQGIKFSKIDLDL